MTSKLPENGQRKRGPLLAEVLSALGLTALIGLGVMWGRTTQQIEDHVDPHKHAGLVLAGSIETDRKITTIEQKTVDIDRRTNENATSIKEVQTNLQQVERKVDGIMRLQELTYREAVRARSAAEGSHNHE